MSELQPSIILVGPFPGASATDEVTTVKRLPFVEKSTVRSVIESVGALGTTADLANAYVRREDGRLIPVNLEALIMRRDLSADRPLEVGDTLVVPQKRRSVVVGGAVLHPAQYPFDPRLGPREYLSLAGGPSKQARTESSFRLITADGKQMHLDQAKQINPGDTIVVPERTFSRSEVVTIVLGVASVAISTASILFLIMR